MSVTEFFAVIGAEVAGDFGVYRRGDGGRSIFTLIFPSPSSEEGTPLADVVEALVETATLTVVVVDMEADDSGVFVAMVTFSPSSAVAPPAPAAASFAPCPLPLPVAWRT